MIAVIQTRFKPVDADQYNHNFGIITKTRNFTNKFETLRNISYNDIVPALKELDRGEFSDVNVGFYLILE